MSELTGALLASLSYCLSFQTRIRAYLVKGKGLLLSQLPRDTAMRPLSSEGSVSRWILKQVLCHKASAPHGENQAPCAPMFGV